MTDEKIDTRSYKIFSSITEMVESRGYLLGFQKEALLEDLDFVETDNERIERVIDQVFYKLFGKGWDDLSSQEQKDIEIAWKGK